MLSRIFGLFAQVERPQERAGGGLGIGLSLVKSLTEMHGGTVEARSAGPGRGSEFVVRWPLPTEESPASVKTLPEKVPATERAGRVLLVDDNVDAAESLAMLLRLWGHEVAVAHDGPAALRAAEAAAPGGRPAGHRLAGHGRLRTRPEVALSSPAWGNRSWWR